MDDSPVEHSSSIIGIVTAICGNIIISIALNLQRYAHLKLKRETEKEADGELLAHGNGDGYDADVETEHDDEVPHEVVRNLEQTVTRRDQTNVDTQLYGAIDTLSTKDSGSRTGFEGASAMSKDDVRLMDINEAGTERLGSRGQRASGRRGLRTPASSADSTVGSHEIGDKIPKYMKSGYWWLGIALMMYVIMPLVLRSTIKLIFCIGLEKLEISLHMALLLHLLSLLWGL